MTDIKHDGIINIATGKNERDINWKNKEIRWSDFVKKLSTTKRTAETVEEYQKMSKNQKNDIKSSKGGFVGGKLTINGRRRKDTVKSRDLITLDMDELDSDPRPLIKEKLQCTYFMYTTHSHIAQKPRYRLILPLTRDVTPEEYQAISRMIAYKIDESMMKFDDSTYQHERLMYNPTTSIDGDFEIAINDGDWLIPDEVLNEYPLGWKDISSWPKSARSRALIKSNMAKQQDPLTKKGVIGAFCRTYSITEAIETFLVDIYSISDDGTRATYIKGSTSGGVVIYDDKFSFSHHGTDPCSGILVNSFDLIRVHRFGELDEDVRSDTKSENLPSLKKMNWFAGNDIKVKALIHKENLQDANMDFKPVDIDMTEEEISKYNENWLRKLETNIDTGRYKVTIDNVKIILEYDIRLKNKLAYNLFSLRKDVKGALPWNKEDKIRHWGDDDESGIRHYLEKIYGISRAREIINDALSLIFQKNKFHPVKEYLNSLNWDGEKRIDTLLVNYFGAEDNIYTRAATRIFICGAVARILNPGCKLDYVLSIVGEQGIKKGTFFEIMAKRKEWFTELNTIKSKESIEQTMGKWIAEMAEMAPTRKSEIEEMKAFITNKEQTLRLAYARNPIDIQKQYVLVASTNESTFLKDPTGDRRYLPIDTDMNKAKKDIREDLPREVDQLYAEAIVLYKEVGYKALMQSKEEEALAKIEQESHRIVDDEEGKIIDFLDTSLPEDWYEKPITERRDYFNDELSYKGEGVFLRDRVCVKEILNECYGEGINMVDIRTSTRINKILQGLKNWERRKSTIKVKGYGTQRGYYRKNCLLGKGSKNKGSR